MTNADTRRPRSPRATELDPEVRVHLDRIWEQAYQARDKDDLKRLYADWAETYDRDHEHIGFFGHRLSAEVLARHLTRPDVARVLDAGAGTGAAGVELAALGFGNLVAVDLSVDMLAKAAEKGVYQETRVADLALPLDAYPGDAFDGAILVGVFSYGQAPAEALDEVLRVVRPGGVVVFTARTDFMDENAMGVRGRIEALAREGDWAQLEVTEALPYLPNKDPEAMFRVHCYRVTRGTGGEVEEGFEDAVRESFESDAYVKRIDHAWIWDSTASRLYERYTRTSGYYLTDCEEEIVRDNALEIWNQEPCIVELGCGSARKILHVLRAAVEAGLPDEPDGIGGARLRYVPIDVSPGALRATVRQVREAFGDRVEIDPRQGMFDDVLSELPADTRKLVFFFGSSIGNLETLGATVGFLGELRQRMRPGDRLVVGTDLHKDEDVLERAYNEEEACRSFFVHMLRRINEHLGADFDPRVFELKSTYELEPEYEGVRTRRVNLRVAPTRPQSTYIQELDLEVRLEPGQPVQVGISRKFEPEAFARVAALAELDPGRRWFDRRRWFALNELLLPQPKG